MHLKISNTNIRMYVEKAINSQLLSFSDNNEQKNLYNGDSDQFHGKLTQYNVHFDT